MYKLNLYVHVKNMLYSLFEELHQQKTAVCGRPNVCVNRKGIWYDRIIWTSSLHWPLLTSSFCGTGVLCTENDNSTQVINSWVQTKGSDGYRVFRTPNCAEYCNRFTEGVDHADKLHISQLCPAQSELELRSIRPSIEDSADDILFESNKPPHWTCHWWVNLFSRWHGRRGEQVSRRTLPVWTTGFRKTLPVWPTGFRRTLPVWTTGFRRTLPVWPTGCRLEEHTVNGLYSYHWTASEHYSSASSWAGYCDLEEELCLPVAGIHIS